MSRIGFYPGSFDPITYGHLDVIARAGRLVDKLVIGVGVHDSKRPLLSAQARVALVKRAVGPIDEHSKLKIDVVTFKGLAVDAAAKAHAQVIIRGIRDASDFDNETRMAQMNASLAPDLETIFVAASPATRMIASSLIKQIALLGGNVSAFLPAEAEMELRKALAEVAP
jgi:pantetheine-phosphate adenylyltransferase